MIIKEVSTIIQTDKLSSYKHIYMPVCDGKTGKLHPSWHKIVYISKKVLIYTTVHHLYTLDSLVCDEKDINMMTHDYVFDFDDVLKSKTIDTPIKSYSLVNKYAFLTKGKCEEFCNKVNDFAKIIPEMISYTEKINAIFTKEKEIVLLKNDINFYDNTSLKKLRRMLSYYNKKIEKYQYFISLEK